VARPDGRPAVLEAGPHDTLWIRILDIGPHLQQYADDGESVWIRRRRTPLSAEQSAHLIAFALSKENHRFALFRQGAQLGALRCRGTPLQYFLARPHPDRSSYFCSELVVEALVAAGLLDSATARPAATYPCDLFFDRSK